MRREDVDGVFTFEGMEEKGETRTRVVCYIYFWCWCLVVVVETTRGNGRVKVFRCVEEAAKIQYRNNGVHEGRFWMLSENGRRRECG